MGTALMGEKVGLEDEEKEKEDDEEEKEDEEEEEVGFGYWAKRAWPGVAETWKCSVGCET